MRCLFTVPLAWGAKVVARLPQRALLGLGRGTAWLAWPLLRKRRRIAAINIALCFPGLDAQRQAALVRETLVNTVVGVFEMMRAWYAPSATLAGMVRIEGIEHLRAATAQGRGVMLLCGHFTHAELAARLLGEALGHPLRGIIRRYNNPCLEQWFSQARRPVFGTTLAKRDVRGLLRALSDGEVVFYAADQDFNFQHAFVPFFGVTAATLAATPDLARRGRATVLPFWFRREDDGRYLLRIEPCWPGWPSGDPERDAAHYMQALEAAVRESPGQYLWAHRRFKTRPPGEPPLY
ncbi:MAG: lipid A biosynthesis lauroyl acyltransferase [Arenimonas sp.]|nr:lipid A biosynthesis lauroyl acyltransferase [Arenimonas sp.]